MKYNILKAHKEFKKNLINIFVMCFLLFLFIPSLVEAKTASEWTNEGINFYKAGRYEEAIKAYDEALKTDPLYTNAWFGKGNSLIRLERFEEAIKAYDEGLKIEPQWALLLTAKGLALYRLERFEEAIEVYDEALKINPKDVDIWKAKGQALSRLGRNSEAEEAFGKANILETAPGFETIFTIAVLVVSTLLLRRYGKRL